VSVSEYVTTNVTEKNKLHFYANQIHGVLQSLTCAPVKF